MREYKFRIYSFISKSFIYFDIYDYPQGIAGGVSESQQYTGLKDSKGNEIYEGDIIKEHHFEDWCDTVGYEYRGVVHYMTRHNYGFNDELKFSGVVTFPNLEENQKYIGNPLQTNCEIIGNIFEHKHLLEK